MNSAYKSPSWLPASSGAAWSELLALLLDQEALGANTPPPGSFVSKLISDKRYWYLQYSGAGRTRQIYLGPENEATNLKKSSLQRLWEEGNAEQETAQRLVSVLLASGVLACDGAAATVIELFARHGLFRIGAVLLGSYAFYAMGPLLGVSWSDGWRTEDIDIGGEPALSVLLTDKLNVESVLKGSPLPFSAVPGLDPRHPSTSYKVRGRSLRIDFLTPLVGKESGAIFLPQLGVSAWPLRFLDYLLEDVVPAILPWKSGVLLRVPAPARFALHKLIVASRRPAHEAVKAKKDISQAAQLLDILQQSRPGDIELAWSALERRSWIDHLRPSIALLPKSVKLPV